MTSRASRDRDAEKLANVREKQRVNYRRQLARRPVQYLAIAVQVGADGHWTVNRMSKDPVSGRMVTLQLYSGEDWGQETVSLERAVLHAARQLYTQKHGK